MNGRSKKYVDYNIAHLACWKEHTNDKRLEVCSLAFQEEWSQIGL
jgi:hypothetical protein